MRDPGGRYVRRDVADIARADPQPDNVRSSYALEQADPKSVLTAIMLDVNSPATARVSAAKALLMEARTAPGEKADAKAEARRTSINERALQLMAKRPH